MGITVVEMLTGDPPLRHIDVNTVIFTIATEATEPELPPDLSEGGREFIKAALTR